jgi:hypothetical protein
MIGNSYGTKNYEEYERNRSRYWHKPVVQRWTTPSWSWWWWRHRRRWRSLRWWSWRSFPLQSSLRQPPFSCFDVCAALSSRELFGVIYIVSFREKYFGGPKNQGNRMIDGRTEVGGAPYLTGHATWPLSALRPLQVCFQGPGCLSQLKSYAPKIWGQFDSV